MQSRPKRKWRAKPEKDITHLDVPLWKVIDGAVFDCMIHHPEYFNSNIPLTTVRRSLNKRAVGAVQSFLRQTISVMERRANQETDG